MKNDLNSVLIEGTLLDDPKECKGDSCSFKIESLRHTEERLVITIVAYAKLAKTLLKIGKKGRKARCVGRITERKGNIRIVADHIEFKG